MLVLMLVLVPVLVLVDLAPPFPGGAGFSFGTSASSSKNGFSPNNGIPNADRQNNSVTNNIGFVLGANKFGNAERLKGRKRYLDDMTARVQELEREIKLTKKMISIEEELADGTEED